ncbi:hypothetical protein AAFF_G00301300 [Aldrovandia affinis]|uniref:UDP-glucuronosyltransferase n=1 Tax=Aldrovandia affinis TaxID=143900 RepID=A0AAD7WRB4_9TELE|nr:hypothetical protein AAFF_G00301300 [Aldrovandia affinis]
MNVQRLSRLHRDQPMKPLDLVLFWIEFVMRHKGVWAKTRLFFMRLYQGSCVEMHPSVLFLSVILIFALPGVHGGKVLVFPLDGSHWVNMRVLVEELAFERPQRFCGASIGQLVDYFQLFQAADIWLMRVDFAFEFPRPTMPNVVYMGGFQCKPAKPLPEDLEEFVQSSGEHGFIIMSLGTLFGELPHDLADEIAAAFAQLPQKVVWRHTGDRPATLGNNTRLVSWMPQNDLLGHPKIRAFVAHGGTNGVQEAIYHGVPVVGLPLILDQPDNLHRMKIKGAAKIVDFVTLDRNIFLQALQEVLHEPSYRMNMQRLSRLHRDQPMKPLDLALFWIEFVMRHKGAAHLRTESYKMPWYAYHSVDVIGVLLAAVLLIILIIVVVIKYLCCRLCCKRKLKHE